MESNINTNKTKTLCVDLTTQPKRKKSKEEGEKNVSLEKERKKRVITTTQQWIPCEMESSVELEYIRKMKEKEEKTEDEKEDETINIIVKQIHYKLAGYKCQDIEKNKYSPEEFVKATDAINKLWECKNECFYCRQPVKILYDYVREPKQWTLDRIDNEKGHNKGNVEISCLQCNIRRKTIYHERYVFTKQMVITKK